MLKNKESEMSITLIVAIVIALIILVVVLAIWSKGSGSVAKTLQGCESRGGECKRGDRCDENDINIPNVECPSNKPVCCKRFKL